MWMKRSGIFEIESDGHETLERERQWVRERREEWTGEK